MTLAIPRIVRIPGVLSRQVADIFVYALGSSYFIEAISSNNDKFIII